MSVLRRATESELAEMQRFAEQESKMSWGPWAHRMVIDGGTNYADAIRAIITDRCGPFPAYFDFDEVTQETPSKIVFGTHEDPWCCARDLAEAIGMILTQTASAYELRKVTWSIPKRHQLEEESP